MTSTRTPSSTRSQPTLRQLVACATGATALVALSAVAVHAQPGEEPGPDQTNVAPPASTFARGCGPTAGDCVFVDGELDFVVLESADDRAELWLVNRSSELEPTLIADWPTQ